MTAFAASRYDEDNDPHKPKVGDPIPETAGGGVIGRVKTITAKELMKLMDNAEEDDDPFHLCKDHPGRPFVKFLVWRAPVDG